MVQPDAANAIVYAKQLVCSKLKTGNFSVKVLYATCWFAAMCLISTAVADTILGILTWQQ